MIFVKLNVTQINKQRIFVGKKGKYLDLVLIEKPDIFGNSGPGLASRDQGRAGQRDARRKRWDVEGIQQKRKGQR